MHRMLHAIIKLDWPAARGVLLHAQALARYLMLPICKPSNFRPPAQQLVMLLVLVDDPVVAASECACVAVVPHDMP